MGVTIRDVARRAGVSISTVSRVLNHTCNVSEDKRVRVEEAAEALGYSPNPAARSLLGQTTHGLGVLLPAVGGEFFSEFLNGIDHTTQQNGYFLLISSSHRSVAEFMAALNGLVKRVDGMLIMATEMEAEQLAHYLPDDLPFVFVNTQVGSERFDAVNFENYAGTYGVTRHLFEKGHRRVAMIKGPAPAVDARERLRGYREAVAEYGGEALEIEGDYTREAGYDAVDALLAITPPPTAVVAPNDYCAFGVLRGVQERGLRVPEDMAVTGFDDIPSAGYTTPPLTTVRVPVREMGIVAIERLLAKIRGAHNGAPVQTTLPVEVVLRASTGD